MGIVTIQYSQTYMGTYFNPATTGGREVQLTVTYDENAPAKLYVGGEVPDLDAYHVTSVTGTYSITDENGIVRTDPITTPDNQHDIITASGTFTNLHFDISPSDTYDGTGHDGLLGINYYKHGLGLQFSETDSTYNGPEDYFVFLNVVCFAEGTPIRTPGGDRPVEALEVGDMVLTASGAFRPIRWLGQRTLDCARFPDREAVHPVRIMTGAFGPGLPKQDIMVSPGHAICVTCVDEVLIQASSLINGATIVQEAVDRVSYWHVELDSHDILLAANLPTESYLPSRNTAFFANGSSRPDAISSDQPCCRPLVPAGPMLELVRDRLRARAEQIGWCVDQTPDPQLGFIADGQFHKPKVVGMSAYVALSSAPDTLSLRSACTKPSSTSASGDHRTLGVAIRSLTLKSASGLQRRFIAEDLEGVAGCYALEQADGMSFLWTDGCAELPARLWEGLNGPLTLQVELARKCLPRWTRSAPEGACGLVGDEGAAAAAVTSSLVLS